MRCLKYNYIKSLKATVAEIEEALAALWVNPFGDFEIEDWFYGAVRYVYDNSLMKGVSNDKFNPNGNLNRAMIVTILWRYDGSPQADGSDFTDVADGQGCGIYT